MLQSFRACTVLLTGYFPHYHNTDIPAVNAHDKRNF